MELYEFVRNPENGWKLIETWNNREYWEFINNPKIRLLEHNGKFYPNKINCAGEYYDDPIIDYKDWITMRINYIIDSNNLLINELMQENVLLNLMRDKKSI